MLDESIFSENAHFQRRAGASVKYEVVELLDDSCFSLVSQHEQTILLDYAEFMEPWEVLDCFGLSAVGDGENEHSAWFQHLPDILKRPADRRCNMLENVRRDDKVILHKFRSDICGGNIKCRFLMVVGVSIIEFFGEFDCIAVPVSHS